MSTATAPAADTHETLDTSALSTTGAAAAETSESSTGNRQMPVLGGDSRRSRSADMYDMSDDDVQFADPDDDLGGGAGAGGEAEHAEEAVEQSTETPTEKVTKPEPKAPVTKETGTETKVDKKAAAESAAAQPDAFDADLINEANRHGIPPDEARLFGTPAALTRALAALDRQAVAAARGKTTDTTTTAQSAAPAAATAQTAAAPAAQPAQAPATVTDAVAGKVGQFEKLKLDLNPELYDESTQALLNGINDHYHNLAAQQRQAIESLKSELSQVSGVASNFRNQEAARFTTEMDQFFNGLDEDFAPDFGKGTATSFAADSTQLKSRHALIQEMSALALADVNLGRAPTSYSDLAQRALRLLHSPKLEQVASKKILAKASERRSQTLERPTSRRAKAQSPERGAADFVNNFYRERGLDKDEEAPDEI